MVRPIPDRKPAPATPEPGRPAPPEPPLPPPCTSGLTHLDVERATSLADEGGNAAATVESQEPPAPATRKKADG
jgi:hypothetical protein